LINLGWRVLVIWECALRLPRPDLSWLPEHIKRGLELYAEWPARAS
jgi:G:T-mismatch repair DNA endonuclease (very short patch repair protein)